jgi:hypothetical protein
VRVSRRGASALSLACERASVECTGTLTVTLVSRTRTRRPRTRGARRRRPRKVGSASFSIRLGRTENVAVLLGRRRAARIARRAKVTKRRRRR